jgi:FtsP/CotA-like multicopper oxidase with cupredoxin domain
LLLAAILLPAYLATKYASTCPTSDVVTDPVLFQWTYDSTGDYHTGTLEMGEATFNIHGETLTTRANRQEGGSYSIPGPTIVMEPDKKYVLRFKNTLPYEARVAEHDVFKGSNITNVHTHGLHISGETPGDDVTRMFEGGYGGDYVYDIPSNHMGETYWYHAHHHGSTYLQVSSGAFGLIVIDDSADGLPANVANMQERHIALGYLEPGNAAGTGGDTLISGTFSAGWTANGTVNGNTCLPPDTWQQWRTLVADQDFRLVDLSFGAGCDGAWRTQVPGSVPANTLTLTGASRADLAVRCSADSTVSVGGSQVANIYVDGTPDASVHPYAADGSSKWSAIRPAYLRDLRGEPITGSETIRMGARSVLGSKYDNDVPNLTHAADGVQEWSLNGATNHPFHLLVYHVQVQSDWGPYEAGEYYDTVAGNCDLRFDMSANEA